MKKWLLIGGLGYLLSQTMTVYLERCERGDGKQCMKAGRAFWEGSKGTKKDPYRALLLFEKGCEAKKPNGLSCSMAGYMHYTGEEGTEANTTRGLYYYDLACIEGREDSCEKIKEHFLKTPAETPEARQEAKKMFTGECLIGNAKSCLLLGNLMMDNRAIRNFGSREDIAVAYTRGCIRRNKESCEKAIKILKEDIGKAK